MDEPTRKTRLIALTGNDEEYITWVHVDLSDEEFCGVERLQRAIVLQTSRLVDILIGDAAEDFLRKNGE